MNVFLKRWYDLYYEERSESERERERWENGNDFYLHYMLMVILWLNNVCRTISNNSDAKILTFKSIGSSQVFSVYFVWNGRQKIYKMFTIPIVGRSLPVNASQVSIDLIRSAIFHAQSAWFNWYVQRSELQWFPIFLLNKCLKDLFIFNW